MSNGFRSPTAQEQREDMKDLLEQLENVIELVGQASLDEGNATSGSTTSLTDTGKDWEPGMWQGAIIHIEVGDTVYVREATGNTADTVNWDEPTADISDGDKYEMRKRVEDVSSATMESKLDTIIDAVVEE